MKRSRNSSTDEDYHHSSKLPRSLSSSSPPSAIKPKLTQGMLPASQSSSSSGAMHSLTAPLSDAMVIADRVNRELFIGNTPPGTSELILIQFLNGAMQLTKLCPADYHAVVNCRLNDKFAFVECASIEDANNALNLNGIPFMGINLRVSRPSKYAGPHVPSKTWQEITGQPIPPNFDTSSSSSSLSPEEKVNRELFVGNTTPEMSGPALMEFLGNAMQQVGLAVFPGNPITGCRLSGKFSFVELRSVEETKNALNLNNIPFMGINLRISRPSKYVGPHVPSGNWDDILAKYMSGELKLPSQNATPAATTKPATRIVELQNMLTEEDLKSDQDYQEIIEDTREECSEFGTLKNVVIPRTGAGATKIFLEYLNVNDATKAMEGLGCKTFDGRKVDATFITEEEFDKILKEHGAPREGAEKR